MVKKNFLIILLSSVLVFILTLFVPFPFGGKNVQRIQGAGNCGNLNYPCQEGLIYFPKDEGVHFDKNTEWWYTNFNVKADSGPTLAGVVSIVRLGGGIGSGNSGYLLFEMTNVRDGKFYYTVQPGYVSATPDKQNVRFDAGAAGEISNAQFYMNGTPFQYKLVLNGSSTNIDLLMNVKERPLVESGDGYVPIFPKYPNELSGYYSFTQINAKGNIKYPGFARAYSDGTAWIDHQWFNTPSEYLQYKGDPSKARPKHEWFSIQLNNNAQVVVWRIFDDSGKEALKNMDVLNASGGGQTTYTDFTLTPQSYWTAPDGRKFANKWRLYKAGVVDLTIATKVPDQYVREWHTYEGTSSVSGIYKGSVSVVGNGYAEMTKTY